MPLTKLAQLPPLIRVVIFMVGVVVAWLPLALPCYWLSSRGVLPGGDLIPTALLYLFFLGLLPRWEQRVHQVSHPWRHIGLTGVSSVFGPLLKGVSLGIVSMMILIIIQLRLGWALFVPMERSWVSLVLSGGLTAMAVGWAEEVLFRGWLLRELEHGWPAPVALSSTSLIFALAHFIKPLTVILDTLPQFFGLVLLGLVLGWARRTPIMQDGLVMTTSLGYPVGLHGGLVWGYYVLNVGQLIQPNPSVPDWVTGINGNPLAGALGILLMSLLAALFYRKSGSQLGVSP